MTAGESRAPVPMEAESQGPQVAEDATEQLSLSRRGQRPELAPSSLRGPRRRRLPTNQEESPLQGLPWRLDLGLHPLAL